MATGPPPGARAVALIALALAIGAMGIYVAEADDAPGGAVIGLLLMVGGVVLGVTAARGGESRKTITGSTFVARRAGTNDASGLG